MDGWCNHAACLRLQMLGGVLRLPLRLPAQTLRILPLLRARHRKHSLKILGGRAQLLSTQQSTWVCTLISACFLGARSKPRPWPAMLPPVNTRNVVATPTLPMLSLGMIRIEW